LMISQISLSVFCFRIFRIGTPKHVRQHYFKNLPEIILIIIIYSLTFRYMLGRRICIFYFIVYEFRNSVLLLFQTIALMMFALWYG
jgi:hypothetical protein